MRMLRRLSSILSLALASTAVPALAQSFPPDNAWVAFPCADGAPMSDPVRDQPGAIDERDLVGASNAPAGFHAFDGEFLYLRLRVDADPNQGGILRPFAWGFALSTDALSTSYEVLITVDGATRLVGVYRNTVTTILDSPTDPADAPPAATFPFATHGRVSAAASTFGGNRDFFIDMAVPWSTLTLLGVAPDGPVVVWAASSSAPDRLDGDFACHDAAGSNAVPSLGRSASGTTTPRATAPPPGSGGAGGGGSGAGGAQLEGGPSCAVQRGRGGAAAAALVALFMGLIWARRARR
jgi:hypothetical protein